MRAIRFLALTLIVTLALCGSSGAGLAQPPDPAPVGPFGDARAAPPVAASPASPAAPALDGQLTTHSLPVAPTNLAPDDAGNLWYTSFADWAFGRLNLATGQVDNYTLPRGHNAWGVATDGRRAWIGALNAKPDYLVSIDLASGDLLKWPVGRGAIFGLATDRATGDIWFASGVPPAINRLSPGSGLITTWSTLPYTSTYDLARAPDGLIWATVQPYGRQALLRLDPAADQLTAWELPAPRARPFRVDAPSADAIWLSEFDPSGNAVARFTPATGELREYALPIASAAPAGIIAAGSKVWTALAGANALAELDAGQPPTRVSIRAPLPLTGATSLSQIAPAAFVQAPASAPSVIQTSAQPLTPAGSFLLAQLPGNGGPFGLAPGSRPDEVWFAATGGRYLARLQTPPRRLYLPLTLR